MKRKKKRIYVKINNTSQRKKSKNLNYNVKCKQCVNNKTLRMRAKKNFFVFLFSGVTHRHRCEIRCEMTVTFIEVLRFFVLDIFFFIFRNFCVFISVIIWSLTGVYLTWLFYVPKKFFVCTLK